MNPPQMQLPAQELHKIKKINIQVFRAEWPWTVIFDSVEGKPILFKGTDHERAIMFQAKLSRLDSG